MRRFRCPKHLLRRDLQGHVYLITGVSRGIGFRLCQQLLKQGATIHGLSRSQPLLQHPNFHWHSVDLSNLAELSHFCNQWLAQHPRLDGLINNAAIIPTQRCLTPQKWEQQWTVNYLSAVFLSQFFQKSLHSNGGRIINVSSTAHHAVHGRLAHINFADLHFERRKYDMWMAYAQSKLALTVFTKQFAQLHSDTIAITVHPGWVGTSIAVGRIPLWCLRLLNPLLRRKGLCTEWEAIQPILAGLLLPENEIHSGEMLCQIGELERDPSQYLSPHIGWLLPSPNPMVYDAIIATRLKRTTDFQLATFQH